MATGNTTTLSTASGLDSNTPKSCFVTVLFMETRWGLSVFHVAELRSGSIVTCILPHHFPFKALDPGGGQLPAFEDAPSFTNWVRSEVGAKKWDS